MFPQLLRSTAIMGVTAMVLAAAPPPGMRKATPPPEAAQIKSKLYFEPNLGQAGDTQQVQFFTRGGGALRTYFTKDGVWLYTRGAKAPVRMEFSQNGAAAAAVQSAAGLRFEAEDELKSVSAYFIGNDKSKWLDRVPNYGRLRAKDVYPGIDLVFYGSAENKLEYDFVVKPGADASRIEISFSGADVKLTPEGDLNLGGTLIQRKARVFQRDSKGKRVEVAAKYQVEGSTVELELGAYDASRELVVDPVVDFGVAPDGSGFEDFRAAKFDSSGAMYLAGYTDSTNFPLAFPYQGHQSGRDAIVQKYNANGSLAYSTYLGGNSLDFATSMAVHPSGAVYLASQSGSPNYPITGTGSQAHTPLGNYEVCLSVIDPFAGSTLTLSWSSCFPQSGATASYEPAVALSPDGAAHMAYYFNAVGTSSLILRVVPGVGVTTSTLLSNAYLWDIAVDASGAVYVCGFTNGSPISTVNAYQTSIVGAAGILGKLIYAGTAASWDYLTYMGGNGSQAIALAVTPAGKVAVVAEAGAAPTPNGSPRAGTSTYLAVFNPRTSGPVTLAYGTYPQPQFSYGAVKSIAIDSKDTVYLAGRSTNGFATLLRVTPNSLGNPATVAQVSTVPDYFFAAAVSEDRKKVLAAGRFYSSFNGQYGAQAYRLDQSLTAQFATNPPGLQFQVDGTTANSGSSQTWIEAESHTLDAPHWVTPGGVGYTFASWADGGAQSKTVAPGGAVTYTANFTVSSYRLSMSISGNGTVATTAINCGAICASQIAANTSVTLVPTAASGWTFTGWSGACTGTGSCTVLMDAVKSVSATFVQGSGNTTPGGALAIAVVGKSGTLNGVRTWTLAVTNADTVVANTAALTAFTLTQVGGVACTPVRQTSLPSTIGNIASGSSVNTLVAINFAGCGNTSRFTLNATVTANGGTKTGTVGLANQFQ